VGPTYEAVVAPYRRCDSKSPLQRAQYADIKCYLPNDVLVKVDRMSMQHSLEVRCPLLDHRIVEAAFRIPTARKMPGLEPKHLLRQVARARLPHELLHLPKRGFTAPIGSWLTGPYAEMFRDLVFSADSASRSTLDLDYVDRLFRDHVRGRGKHGYELWAVLVFEVWSRQVRSTTAAADGTPSVTLNTRHASPTSGGSATVN
jgi:asparagine synthase (glutamine-hydrolysing)